MELKMKASHQKLFLLLLILVPTALFAIVGELSDVKVLSLVENCQCYPGLTVWGYALDGLYFFLVLNIFLLPVYFSKVLPRLGMILLVVVEITTYGWASLVFASNLSTTNPTPNRFVLISAVPVALVLVCGYVLRMIFGFFHVSNF
jgi:hypothetical protein